MNNLKHAIIFFLDEDAYGPTLLYPEFPIPRSGEDVFIQIDGVMKRFVVEKVHHSVAEYKTVFPERRVHVNTRTEVHIKEL